MQTQSISQVTIPHVRSIERLNVAGGRFAEVRYGETGHASFLLPDGLDEAQALFQLADEQLDRARQAIRRAGLLRRSAWLILQARESTRI